MKVWAKISSLFVIFFLIQGIYYSIRILIITIGSSMRTPWFMYLLPFTGISMIIFYFPLFYYGWVKKPKNREMKYWAKILTIIFPLLAIIGFISPWGLDFPKDILFILPIFALIVPLYYYAWRG